MDKTRDAWKDHLVMVGEDVYSSLSAAPGSYDSKALLEAVAAMIEENNAAHR